MFVFFVKFDWKYKLTNHLKGVRETRGQCRRINIQKRPNEPICVLR